MIKVGFDISQLAFRGGVASYTRCLAEQLSQDQRLGMVFLYNSLRKPYGGTLRSVKRYPLPPILSDIFFNRLRLFPIEMLLGEVDIYHSSDWIQAPSHALKVTTYHDVIPLKNPEWSIPRIVKVHRRRLELVEKEIDMVITVSESTKKDLLEISGIPSEKITVIYEGVGENYKPQPEEKITAFKKEWQLPDEFVLAIGGIGARKNLERVKEAAGSYPLVISGQTLPYLPEEEMPLLYTAAKVLLYPSLYEGFGLPVLEAMACGTPVITSSTSSLPEVGGEVALYVDPENVNDIKQKLDLCLGDEKIRGQMSKKGLEQAKKFSWDETARQTVLVYQKLLQTRKL